MAASAFQKILLAGAGTYPGTMSLVGDQLQWKARESDRMLKVPAEDMTSAAWYPGTKGQLHVLLKNGTMHRFLGFPGDAHGTLAKFLGAAGVELTSSAFATAGQSWGDVAFKGKNIVMQDMEGAPAMVLPMAALAAAVAPAANDVELQFTTDDTVGRDDEALVEMRLWVPPGHAVYAAEAAGAEPNAKGEQPSAAQMLQRSVMAQAGLASVTGELVAEFEEKASMFLTPRGRYAIELYGSFMRMVGKTNEFKVAYSSISRFSYLPRPSATSSSVSRFCIVISLDDPVKHGQQRYAHLVLQVDKTPHTCDIHADEATRAERFGGIAAKVSDDLPKVMATVFKHLTGKKVYLPRRFESALKAKCVKCALRSSDGLLYPLDKSFMFIHKPATFIRFSEVSLVEFKRLESTTFDVHLRCKSVGGEPGREFTFTGIDKREKDPLANFCRERGLSVLLERTMASSLSRAATAALGEAEEEESDEEDSDFHSGKSGSSDSDDSDEEGGGSGSDGGGAPAAAGGGSDSGAEDSDEEDDELGLDAGGKAALAAARKSVKRRGGGGGDGAAKRARKDDGEGSE